MPIIYVISLLVGLVAIDQGIKLWISSAYQIGESATVIPGVITLTNLHNHGAAWSMLQGRMSFFVIISIVAILVIGYYLYKLRRQFSYALTLVLLMAGTIGNFIDRLVHGYVIDMFQVDINLPFLHFVFNFADACLTVGVLMLLVVLWRADQKDAAK